MALVVITGYGCSGKTTRALELKSFLEKEQSLPVEIVDESTIKVSRSVFDESKTEKPARAALLSAVTNHISRGKILICDSMNYLKSLRYQYYCIARESSVYFCCIHVGAPVDKVLEWNENRLENEQYNKDTLENLCQRYEEPSNASRWDSPLFVAPWIDKELPLKQIFDAITKGDIKPPTSATAPTIVNSTSYLQKLESTTTAVISYLISLPVFGGPTNLSISLPTRSTPIQASMELPPNKPSPSKFQRLRRQFININKQARDELTDERIATLFIDYIQDALRE